MTLKQILMTTIIVTFFSLSITSQAKENQIYKSKKSNIAIKGYDSVAYFTENKAIKGDKNINFTYKGALWLFSSQENKSLFESDPIKYSPQYGGWCAYAMSDSRAVKINPKAFEIYNNKLYLNYSKSVQGHWRKEKELFIQQADEFYPNVVETTESNQKE